MKLLEKFFIIKCKECGCQKRIEAKEIPIGECQYCERNFGFYFFPGQIINEDRTVNNDHVKISHLEEGDVVTINTKLYPEDPNRIFSIQRAGEFIYKDGKCTLSR